MEYNEVKNIVKNTTKGSIHTITYRKELKTRKGVTDVITKKTITQGRLGVTYDNMKAVYNKRNRNELPAENAGLPAGTEWEEFPYFIKSIKTGKIQLRISRFNSAVKSQITYYKNGVEVKKEDIQDLCYANEFPVYDANKPAPDVFNIGIEKIESIK